MERVKIKENARKLIKGNLLYLLEPYLYYLLAQIVLDMIVSTLFGSTTQIKIFGFYKFGINLELWRLLLTPISVGITAYYLNFVRKKDNKINDIFYFFKFILLIIAIDILKNMLISLGLILLIIPGIILCLMFSMTTYLIADGERDFKKIFNNSVKMMKGYKLDYLIFNLSFIGWFLLGLFTFGLAYIYVLPYASVANALYYEELKKKNNM